VSTGIRRGEGGLSSRAVLITVTLLLSLAVVLSAASALNFAKSTVSDDSASGMKKWLENVIEADFPEAADQERFLSLIDDSLDRKTLMFSQIPNPDTGKTGLVVVYIDGVPKMWVSDADMIDSFSQLDVPFIVEGEKGLISTRKNARPFYTNSSENPVTVRLSENQTTTVTFWVTPTDDNGSYEFFAYALSEDGEEMARTDTFTVTLSDGNHGNGRETPPALEIPEAAK